MVADQLSKLLVLRTLLPGETVELLPVLDFTLLFNTGAAFSLLADQAGWQRWFFSGVAAAVSLALTVMLLRLPRGTAWTLAASYALILGGALGNLIDRVRYGHVVDFVHVHWERWYYPAFNVADSAITVGALLLIYDAFRSPAKG